MLLDHWPLAGLRLRTPRLELRLPDPEELAGLAELAADGVHDPSVMPFNVPWTDTPVAEQPRSVIQYNWSRWAAFSPESWELGFSVFEDGRQVGQQALGGERFPVLRQASSGSWLGLAHQGRGLGTEMRAAVLELAFVGLNASEAVTSAMEDNVASLAVSAKLGYEEDGIARLVVRGGPVTQRRLRLSRERWAAHRRVPVEIVGLAPCLPLFGLAPADGAGSEAG
ncbi:GNAT family N-acetyltransferase [Streptomyces sp. NBRC 109706]|uniref:GNAT family N-acetyltransferase n=1 Tax=Streptomyces sp. NBRC 109706 TaxID=1550035 RepID=UPI0007816ECD|nr:GNAT family N-acetyltransferase [Streptomyces sp. NBRC 109706]